MRIGGEMLARKRLFYHCPCRSPAFARHSSILIGGSSWSGTDFGCWCTSMAVDASWRRGRETEFRPFPGLGEFITGALLRALHGEELVSNG